jgi:hypothetical protein
MPAFLALVGPVCAAGMSAVSQSGRAAASLETLPANPPFNRLHHWYLYLRPISGDLPAPDELSIGAVMKRHSHFLPTTPKITKGPRAGEHIIEGVKFDRLGEWMVQFGLKTNAGEDRITFAVNVGIAVWRDFDDEWTPEERAVLKKLLLSNLPVRAAASDNEVAYSEAAADLSHRLFFTRD